MTNTTFVKPQLFVFIYEKSSKQALNFAAPGLNNFPKVRSHFVICFLLVITILTNSSTIAFATAENNTPIIYENPDSYIITDWNDLTTEIAMKEKLSPLEISRIYSLVHISMYDSLLAAGADTGKSHSFDNRSYYISSIAEAVSDVLVYLFPNHADEISKLKSTQINQLHEYGDNKSSIIKRGKMLGDMVSTATTNYAKTDNSELSWNNSKPIHTTDNICIWNGSNPVNPMGGYWKTYIIKSGSEVQPEKPLPCNSEADLQDLRETFEVSKNRTAEQNTAIHYWGDVPPPVIWNKILNEQIHKYNMSMPEAAYSSVYLNVGMYDAFVSCWYTKYNYWTARPFERIANLTTEIPTPNFPSYTSGHSVISTVASRILGELFPNQADYFKGKSIEASLSRLFAGIHFKQDIISAIDQGDKVAEKVVEDMHKPIHPFVYGT